MRTSGQLGGEAEEGGSASPGFPGLGRRRLQSHGRDLVARVSVSGGSPVRTCAGACDN